MPVCCRYREAFLNVVEQLVALVGESILDDRTIELTFPKNPDGKYLMKGATRAAWEMYHVPDQWRSKRGEGVIDGKRCGTTQNIGPAARKRWRERKHQLNSAVA
jgi:hypothetical protein